MPKSDYKSTQSMLKAVGYPITVDGKWGNQSRAALSSFQRAFNPYRDPVTNAVFAPGVAPLKVDGVPGPSSAGALDLSAKNRGQLSLNFHYYEFACGNGHDPFCGGWLECPRALLVTAEIIRRELFMKRKGIGLSIEGPSRCDARNTKIIGGASNSQHLHRLGGNAFDLPDFFTWEEIRDVRAGVTAMEVRAGTGDLCYHVDIRPGSTTSPQVFGWTPRLAALHGEDEKTGARSTSC